MCFTRSLGQQTGERICTQNHFARKVSRFEIPTNVNMCTCMRTRARTCVCAHANTHTHAHTRTHANTQTPTHRHTHSTHTHTNTRTRAHARATLMRTRTHIQKKCGTRSISVDISANFHSHCPIGRTLRNMKMLRVVSPVAMVTRASWPSGWSGRRCETKTCPYNCYNHGTGCLLIFFFF